MQILRQIAPVQVKIHYIQVNKLLKKYESTFSGMGCIKGEHHIEIKKDAEPVVHPIRKIPFAIQKKVKEALDSLVSENLIEKTEDAAECVNALVIVK